MAECCKCGALIENENPVEAWNARAQTPREQELLGALKDADKTMRWCFGAIEINQIEDKDVHGGLKRGWECTRQAIAKAESKSTNNQTDGVTLI